MNQTPQHPERLVLQLVPDPNPWDDAAALPRPSRWLSTLLCLLVTLFALWPVLRLPETLTPVALILAVLTLAFFVRSVSCLVWGALLFGAGTFVGGVEGGTAALCYLLVLTVGAYLICTLRSRWLCLIPVICYVAALVWTGDALLAVLPLLALPAAGLLAYSTMKNDGRVSATVLSSGMLLLCGALGLAIVWYRQNGSISFDAIFAELDRVRDELIVTMQGHEYAELMQEYFGDYLSATGLDAKTLITVSVEQTFHLLPALVILPVNLLCFAAQSCCTAAFRATGLSSLVTRTSQLFIMSTPSALIFIVCGVAQLLFGAQQTVATTVMLNLLLILFPAMLLVGVYKFLADVRHQRLPLMIGLCIAAALFAPLFLLVGLAVSGALTTLIRPLITRMVLSGAMSSNDKDKNNRDDGHDNDNHPTH